MDMKFEEINTQNNISKENDIDNNFDLDNIENINSPQLIQDILHLSTNSTKNGFQLQNNMIKSLYSFNNSFLSVLDSNIDNFNPEIYFLQKKHKIYNMDFNKNNFRNSFLSNKIEQYNDLKRKISEYKNNKNNKDISEDDIRTQKLFFINHPLINLFTEEIDINEMKKEIKQEYMNKMKDNTEYKPVEEIPHPGINIMHDLMFLNEVGENEEEEELEEENEDISLHDGDNEEIPELVIPPIDHINNDNGNQDNNLPINNNDNIHPIIAPQEIDPEIEPIPHIPPIPPEPINDIIDPPEIEPIPHIPLEPINDIIDPPEIEPIPPIINPPEIVHPLENILNDLEPNNLNLPNNPPPLIQQNIEAPIVPIIEEPEHINNINVEIQPPQIDIHDDNVQNIAQINPQNDNNEQNKNESEHNDNDKSNDSLSISYKSMKSDEDDESGSDDSDDKDDD